MAKKKNGSKIQQHIEEDQKYRKDREKYFDEFRDQMSNHLTKALNPMVKVKNGEEKEMLLFDVVGSLYEDNKMIKSNIIILNDRTLILEDLSKIKEDWCSFKKRLMKILKPLFKFIIWVSGIFIVLYFLYMWISGKMTMPEIMKSVFDIFF